jgi:hypothetical protein
VWPYRENHVGGFPIVEREEMAAYGGRYRSCELCLAWLSALAAGDPDAEISL